jgi:hypothetical protein
MFRREIPVMFMFYGTRVVLGTMDQTVLFPRP